MSEQIMLMSEQRGSDSQAESRVKSSHTLLLIFALGVYVAANHLIYLIEIR